ncbi:Uncharacterised protein [Haemophilus influenzae]|nr:hypothetical protein BV026_01455 [Haemophilus influenzae]PRI93624.1 hypothetical protein BV027_01396 [Haemophilus influenzae]CWW87135.1 Uncharacterised protein [Haemophilus influenzae]CWX36809.1 Uncharacterised protein [Haemophilus influenzae]
MRRMFTSPEISKEPLKFAEKLLSLPLNTVMFNGFLFLKLTFSSLSFLFAPMVIFPPPENEIMPVLFSIAKVSADEMFIVPLSPTEMLE